MTTNDLISIVVARIQSEEAQMRECYRATSSYNFIKSYCDGMERAIKILEGYYGKSE